MFYLLKSSLLYIANTFIINEYHRNKIHLNNLNIHYLLHFLIYLHFLNRYLRNIHINHLIIILLHLFLYHILYISNICCDTIIFMELFLILLIIMQQYNHNYFEFQVYATIILVFVNFY